MLNNGEEMYFYTLNEYLQKTFGSKVYKLSLSLGTICPNRDGTVGNRGCIFCSEKGSGDFAESSAVPVFEQIESAKRRVINKIKTNKYIAYFQSFTSTYVPFETLKKALNDAINHPDIVAISIATRPDCISQETLELIKTLNNTKPIWVELGLQTIHKETADYIRRGYELNVFDDAVKRLKSAKISVIVHMIIGLPDESNEMIYKTAEYIGKSGADGIKLQLLHVLKNTDLAIDYSDGRFNLPTLQEYSEIVAECIKRIPRKMVVHRITGDGKRRDLIAPLWSTDKKYVYQYMIDYFKNHNLEQGINFKK